MSRLRREARSGLDAALRRLPAPREEAARQLLRASRSLVTGRPLPRPRPTGGPDPWRAVRTALDRAYAAEDEAEVSRAIRELHRLRAHAERLASPVSLRRVRLSESAGVKSAQYMIDLLPHVQRALAEHPRGTTFTVLDVGPGNGHGTALLAALYRQGRLGYRMQVTALDIDARYGRYLRTISPYVRFVREDLFEHDATYDFVVSSHVIEHVPDPVGFSRRMQELARHAVFVAAPYREPADDLTAGHISVIDESVVDKLDATEVTVFHSVSWGAFKEPPYESVIARLPGLAD